jgi:hypothetical protein
MPPLLIIKIDDELARLGRKRRWLSLSLGRGPDYIRDIARGKSRQPKGADLMQIAAILGKPVDYFLGSEEGAHPSHQLITSMPTDPHIVARAEQLADMVMTRLIQRRGIADFMNHEARGRIVAAAMDALLEAERQKLTITDAFVSILVAVIGSLL